MQRPEPAVLEIRVAWATILKILAAVLAAWALVHLWAGFEVLLIAALFAMALSPAVDWMEGHGFARGWAVATLAVVGITVLGAFMVLVLPPLTNELSALWKSLPHLRQNISHEMERSGLASRVVLPLLDLPRSPEFDAWVSRPMGWGPTAVGAVAASFLVAVLSLYLILDGRTVVAWLLAYVPRRHRGKMSAMVPEVFGVVKAYAIGQILTSVLFSVFCFVILTAFHVPAALSLALFAGVCDAVPVAGIFIAMAAAALISLTVNSTTALIVLGLYVVYHLFETYVLVPRLYGNRLRLSTLTVLLAIVVGGMLDGVIGAILALPLVAAYPVVEKHWLDDYLHPDAVEDHASLRAAISENAEGQEAAVDAVMKGEKPAASV
ncbi:MAG TPA: AI-2E family transporter [Thermoanaerobaculia bacterium]